MLNVEMVFNLILSSEPVSTVLFVLANTFLFMITDE